MNELLEKVWPILTIFILWFVFSSPYFLHGKAPFPADYQQNAFSPWEAYNTAKGPVKNAAVPDVISQIYPWKHFTIESLKNGSIPFWNSYSFSGTLHLANYQSAVLSPFNLLFFIFPFIDAWSMLILLQPLLAGIFMYLFVRSLHVSKMGSLLSSVGFMFCGFMTVWMVYGTLGYAILFLPLALWSIEKFINTSLYRYLLFLAISIPLSFFSGHFQISLYFLLFILVWIVFRSIQMKNWQIFGWMSLSVLSGLLISMPQILPSMQAYSDSLRSTFFQKGEAIPLGYLPTLFAPDFFGNPVTRNDWFGHYAEWNGYIGLILLMLSIFAILKKRNAQTLLFFFLGVISLLFAFSTPFLDVLIALHVPVLSTSAASRIIILFSFSFLLLSGIGFDESWSVVNGKNIRIIIVWLSLFLLFFVCLWSIVLFKLFFPLDKIAIAKQNLLLPTALFIGFSVLLVSSFFIQNLFQSKQRKKLFAMISTLILLIAIFDLYRFTTKWQPFSPKQLVFSQTPLMNYLASIPPTEGVWGNYGAEDSVYYHLSSVDGYDAVYNQRYGELIAYINSGKFSESEKSLVRLETRGIYTDKAVNFLNIRYVIHKISDGQAPWVFPYWSYPNGQFSLVYKDSAFEVYRNNAAFPRVFLSGNYAVVTNPRQILKTMFAPKTDLRNQLFLEQNPIIPKTSGIVGIATIVSYQPNSVTISVTAKSPALLFLYDAYSPEWHAKVDNQPTQIFRTDYDFRSVKLPAGKHTVIFYYYPKSFIWGVWIAIVGIISMLCIVFFIFSRMEDR